MFVLYVFERYCATAVRLIYFKYCKPIISIKYLFQDSSKGLFSHRIIDIAVTMNKQNSQDFIRKYFYIYFPLFSLYLLSGRVVTFPWVKLG